MREKLLKAVLEFEAILVPEGTPTITFLGTPQTEESIYNELRERGYNCKIWPARVPEKDTYNGALAESIVEMMEKGETGKPTDPQRFGEVNLAEREAAYGRSGFSLQFMLDTTLSDQERYPLKTGDLIIFNCNADKAPLTINYGSSVDQQIRDLPNVGFTGDRWYRPMMYDERNWVDYEGKIMFIDPSGRGADELAYAIVFQLHGKLFVMDVDGFRGGYEEVNLVRLAKLAKQFGVHEIVTESNFGDGMFNSVFKPVLNQYHQCGISEVRHNKQKEVRIIDTLEPIMNQHKVIVDERVVRKDVKQLLIDKNFSLFYQLTRLTKERGALKHDDRLDALAGAVAFWVESMARNEVASIQKYHEEMWDKELKEFTDHQVLPQFRSGRNNRESGWMNLRR